MQCRALTTATTIQIHRVYTYTLRIKYLICRLPRPPPDYQTTQDYLPLATPHHPVPPGGPVYTSI
jgi:hypothetical protein